ncbi:MAG: thioredoxin domain-containing protein [Candidatus Falkowbacteria bacterium]
MGIEERLAQLKQKADYRPRKKWYQKWWGCLIIVILFIILISLGGGALWVYNKAVEINQDKYLSQQKLSQQNNRILTDGSIRNYTLGTSTPKLTIVEFSDLACPFCKESAPIIRYIALRYNNQVKVVFRDMIGHQNSLELALAARCAGEQGKFWEMHDEIFAQQDTLDINNLYAVASTAGVKDKTKFDSCLSSQKYLPQIKADMADATALGIKATPTWYFDGVAHEGVIPQTNFINIIETLLKK